MRGNAVRGFTTPKRGKRRKPWRRGQRIPIGSIVAFVERKDNGGKRFDTDRGKVVGIERFGKDARLVVVWFDGKPDPWDGPVVNGIEYPDLGHLPSVDEAGPYGALCHVLDGCRIDVVRRPSPAEVRAYRRDRFHFYPGWLRPDRKEKGDGAK